MLWTPASRQAYNDGRARIIAEGADPETEIAAIQEVVEAELERSCKPVRRRPQRLRRRTG